LLDRDAQAEILRLAREGHYDLLILSATSDRTEQEQPALDVQQVLRNAPCHVFLASPPAIPLEPEK
jgi:hypothetical protein